MQEANALLSARTIGFKEIEDTVAKALDLAGNCQEAYRLASDRVRRQFNQAFFKRLLIDSGDVEGAELSEPFSTLLGEDVSRRFERALPEPASSGVGSIYDTLVDLRGIEPLTS